jgi:4-hydroxy-tetrahydrodipicolinate reductase
MERAKVVVVGAQGRMGRRVVAMLESHPTLMLGRAFDRDDDADAAIAGSHVVIDFAAPAAAARIAPICARQGTAYLVASTALSGEDESALNAASQSVPVLQAANLSIGVNVMAELVADAAARLAGFDVEISEIHHKHKRDAPSGTALALGAAARRGRPALKDVLARPGNAVRATDELGYAATRGGDAAGEHTVFFFGEGERIELTHRATTPDIFARGALVAAAWLVTKPAGRYTMRDVLIAPRR